MSDPWLGCRPLADAPRCGLKEQNAGHWLGSQGSAFVNCQGCATHTLEAMAGREAGGEWGIMLGCAHG